VANNGSTPKTMTDHGNKLIFKLTANVLQAAAETNVHVAYSNPYSNKRFKLISANVNRKTIKEYDLDWLQKTYNMSG